MSDVNDTIRLASNAGWSEDSYTLGISDGAGGVTTIYYSTAVDGAGSGDPSIGTVQAENNRLADYLSPGPGVRAVDEDGNPASLQGLIRADWRAGDYDANCEIGDECYPFYAKHTRTIDGEEKTYFLLPIVVSSPIPAPVPTGEIAGEVYYDTSLPNINRVLNQTEAAELVDDNDSWGLSEENFGLFVAQDLTRLAEGSSDSILIDDGQPIGDIDMAEFARIARFKEQCFLLANVREFATFNQRLDPAYEWAGRWSESQKHRKAMLTMQARNGVANVINDLTKTDITQHFFDLRPDQLSVLVPTLRIFKLKDVAQYERGPAINTGFLMLPGEIIGSEVCTEIVEVPFFNNPIDDMARVTDDSSPGEGRHLSSDVAAMSPDEHWKNYEFGRGLAGIKGFEWDYVGNNPVSARTDINAKLTLYFQKFEDIVRSRVVTYVNADTGEDQAFAFSYAELAMRSGGRDTETLTVNGSRIDPYRLRAHIGWAIPPDYEGQDFTEEQKAAIAQSFTTLYLTIIDHTFDIRDDGTVDFTVEYKAYIESTFGDAGRADILSTAEISERRKYREQQLEEAKTTCDAETIKEIKKNQAEEIDVEKQQAYQTILDALDTHAGGINNLPGPLAVMGYLPTMVQGGPIEKSMRPSRIYNIKIPFNETDMFLNEGPFEYDGAQSWLTQALGSATVASATSAGGGSIATGIQERIEQAGGFNEGASSGTMDALSSITVFGNRTVSEVDGSRDVTLHWFYFGDLIHVGLERLEENIGYRMGVPGLNTGAGIMDDSAPPNIEADMVYKSRVVLGPIDLVDPLTEQVYQVNLADIPISVNYFVDWFIQKIMSKNEAVYPLMVFIREAINDLIIRVLNDSEFCFGGTIKQKAVYQSNYFVAKEVALNSRSDGPGISTVGSPINMDPLEYFEKKLNGEFLGAALGGRVWGGTGAPATPGILPSGLPQHRTYSEYITKANCATFGAPWPLLSTNADDLAERNTTRCSDDYYKYVIISCSEGLNHIQSNNREEDMENGIIWYHIGSPTGPVKTIKFNKTDMTGVKEARFFSEGFDGLSQLREPYDVTVELYGMPNIYPGTLVFIDPIGLGTSLGTPSDDTSLAFLLGFGGYHQVTKVKNKIKAGEYVTTMECKWISSGNSEDPRRGALIGQSEETDCNVDPSDFGSLDGVHAEFPVYGGPYYTYVPGTVEAAAESFRSGEMFGEVGVSIANSEYNPFSVNGPIFGD